MSSENLDVRPLVIGADGLVGTAVAERLEQRFPHTVSSTRTELDITDRWRVAAEIERLRPTAVINCAAESDLDTCEEDPERASRLNAQAPAHLSITCHNAGARLIHLSTDYVFDGSQQREYDEADPPAPLSVYGRTKLEGEQAVLSNLVDAIVLRVSFVFGPGRPTFIDKITRRLLLESGPVPAVDSWVTRPTASFEIAAGIEQLLLSDATGVWHLANPPAVSRFSFARGVAELLGCDPERVVRVDESELNLRATRPPRSALSTKRFEARFGATIRPWQDWASEYLELRGRP
jgi:dTDP-4-dehydrorhamnose reductase